MESTNTSPTASSCTLASPTDSVRQTSESPTSPRRDTEFYCVDVVFQVEEVLFKVPRRPFEQDSQIFRDMFDMPFNGGKGVKEGDSDEHPIVLEATTEADFRALLSVIFRPSYGTARALVKDQWISVLKLSTMWMFDSIRDQAIAELGKLVRDPVSRIVLARLYRLSGWMEPALISLAQQDVLSPADLEKLGWDTAAKLFQVRESIAWGGSCACGCNYCTVAHGPLAQTHLNGHAHAHVGGSARLGMVSAATVRKSYDFTQQIRELFGTDLH